MPIPGSANCAIAAAQDLTTALLHPSPASPIVPINTNHRAALQQLATTFAGVGSTPLHPPPGFPELPPPNPYHHPTPINRVCRTRVVVPHHPQHAQLPRVTALALIVPNPRVVVRTDNTVPHPIPPTIDIADNATITTSSARSTAGIALQRNLIVVSPPPLPLNR